MPESVDADPVRSFRLLSLAADGAFVNSIVLVARLLRTGAEGVNPDPARAVELYTRFIEDGKDTELKNMIAVELAAFQESMFNEVSTVTAAAEGMEP